MSRKAFAEWLTERVPIDPEWLRKPLREELPVHLKTWLWCLGGTPLMLFGIQVITGILLTFYYVPYPNNAYDSIHRITFVTRLGWVVRGLHHGASQLMVVAVFLHMVRVFGTRAFRKPRELTWVMGVFLFFCTLGLAFTGYSLVYDCVRRQLPRDTLGLDLRETSPVQGRQDLLLRLDRQPAVDPLPPSQGLLL